ncbi:MAG: hypothetical protein WBO82_01835 [Neisseria sp.]
MIERLIPIFVVVGVLSSIGYLSLLVYVIYSKWGSSGNVFSRLSGTKQQHKQVEKNTHQSDDVVLPI